MGGKRPTLRRRALPRRWVSGGLDRLNRSVPEVQALILGAQQIIEDRGGEGSASLLMQRAAYRVMHLDLLLGRDELRLAQGGDIDRSQYVAAAQVWLRYAQALGLSRVAKPVENLHSYMRRKSAASQSAPATVDATPSPSASAGPSPAADLSTGGAENE